MNSALSPALWKLKTAAKQILEPTASRGPSGPGAQRRDPPPGSGHLGPDDEVGDWRLARAGAGWRIHGDTATRPPLQAAVSEPGRHSCWTAPTPARPCPRRPPSRNSRGRAAGGPSQGPRAGAVGTRAVIPVAAAAPRRRRRRRGVACPLLAHGRSGAWRPPSISRPPGARAALRPFTSHLLPFPSRPAALHTCSQRPAHA